MSGSSKLDGVPCHATEVSPRPTCTVVIPTFNRAEHVASAVESVLQQTVRDVEIIVVDDGSTDDTFSRLSPFSERITYVRTENQGPALARNEGMRRARGEFIAWLDSDDLYYPFKLQVQVEILERFPDVGLVFTDFSAFDDAGFFDEFHLRDYHSSAYRRGGLTYDRLFTTKLTLSQLPGVVSAMQGSPSAWLARGLYLGSIYDGYMTNTVVFTNSILFRRELLQKTGLQNARFGMFHDLEFVLRIAKHCPVAFVDVPTYKLRYHPGQISTTSGPKGERTAIRKQRDLLRVLIAHGVDDTGYYSAHKAHMDRQQARLCRAVAIPLMSLSRPSRHEAACYPRRARRYLRRCAALGRPERLLWALSFAPPALRRVGLAVLTRGQRLVAGARGGMGARAAG